MAKEFDLGCVRGAAGATGPAGPAGPAGAPGVTPRISVGNTFSLAPGAEPYVELRDGSSPEAPVLDFGIPAATADMNSSVYDPHNRHQDIFAYADSHGGRGATIIVAAADSRNKDSADFICAGESDQLVLSRAINSLPAGGGSILLMEGTYHLDTEGLEPSGGIYRLLHIGASHVSITGQGSATLLKLEDAAVGAGVTCALVGISGDDFYMSRLTLDGSKANNSGTVHGIYQLVGADSCTVESCNVKNCSGSGIKIHGNASGIKDNKVSGCDKGMDIGGTESYVRGCEFNDGNIGIYVGNCSHGVVIDNRVSNNAQKGICLSYATYYQVVSNVLLDNPIGIYQEYSSENSFFLNIVKRSDYVVGQGSTNYGEGEYPFRFVECQRCAALFNRFFGKGTSMKNTEAITMNFVSNNWNMTT